MYSSLTTNSLSVAEICPLMKREFSRQSTCQQKFNEDFVNLSTASYSSLFCERIMDKLNQMGICLDSLQNLHLSLPEELKEYNFEDGVNKISHSFYEMDEKFYKIYYEFLNYIKINFFHFDFYFQKTPTLRLHTPNSPNNNHYPRYHSDIAYGHPPQEINIWIPLTPLHPLEKHGFKITTVKETYLIVEKWGFDLEKFIESSTMNPDTTEQCHQVSRDVETEFGEMLVFDSRCLHTGMPLIHHSRVSMDIRIIPKYKMDNLSLTYQGKGRQKILFIPGEGYHAESIGLLRK